MGNTTPETAQQKVDAYIARVEEMNASPDYARLEMNSMTREELDELQKRVDANLVLPEAVKALREEIKERTTQELAKEKAMMDTVLREAQKQKTKAGAGMAAAPSDGEPSMWEKTKTWTKENLDVSKWSEWPDAKKAKFATITLGVAGVAALGYWLFGGRKKESAQEKSSGFPKWLLWLPVVGLAAWGGYRLYKNVDKFGAGLESLQKTGSDLIDDGKKAALTTLNAGEGLATGAYRGIEKVREGFGPLADRLMTLPNVRPIMEKQYSSAPYESKAEFFARLSAAIALDGGGVIRDGAMTAFFIGKEIIKDTGKLGLEVSELMFDPSWENFKETCIVYGEGTVLYASSLAGIRLALLQNPKPGLWETAAWPVTILKKGGQVSWGFLTGETMEYGKDVTVSTMKFWKYLQLRVGNITSLHPTVEMYQARKEMWLMYNDMVERAENNRVASSKMIETWRRHGDEMVNGMKRILLQLEKEGRLPESVTDYLKRHFSSQRIEQLDLDGIKKVVRHTQSFNSSVEEARAVAEASETVKMHQADAAPDTTDKGTKVRKAAGAESMAEPVAERVPKTTSAEASPLRIHEPDDIAETMKLADDPDIAAMMKAANVTPEQAKELLNMAESSGATIDRNTRELIARSRKAKKIIAGAMQTKDVKEIQRALNAAKSARTIRLGWNAFGAAADVMGVAMMFVDFQANRERIADTNNPELKALYEQANYVYAGQGGTSVVGLVIGGIAVYSALGTTGSALTALAAPAGMVMLPIGAASFAARHVHAKVEESGEYHAQRQSDLTEKSAGAILEHIGKTSSEELLNWTQGVIIANDTLNVQSANEGQRWIGYRAYFEKLAANTIPPATVEDLPEDEARTEDRNAVKATLDRENVQRRNLFIANALSYLAYATNGTFDLAKADDLENARLFAQLEHGRIFIEGGTPRMIPWQDDSAWNTEVQKIFAYRNERRTEWESHVLSLKGSESFDTETKAMLLENVRDDLALCERKIVVTDYPNWTSGIGVFGGYGEDDFRIAVRAWLCEKMNRKVFAPLKEKGNALTESDIRNAFATLKDILQKSQPISIVEEMGDAIHVYYKNGKNIASLDVESILSA